MKKTEVYFGEVYSHRDLKDDICKVGTYLIEKSEELASDPNSLYPSMDLVFTIKVGPSQPPQLFMEREFLI